MTIACCDMLGAVAASYLYVEEQVGSKKRDDHTFCLKLSVTTSSISPGLLTSQVQLPWGPLQVLLHFQTLEDQVV